MALSIKDEATDRLVRRYANLHRTSFTGAINRAVREALIREGQPLEDDERTRRAAEFMRVVREVQAEVAKLPVLDPRSPDELLYDADGLPI